jgi:hypothetical protein
MSYAHRGCMSSHFRRRWQKGRKPRKINSFAACPRAVRAGAYD